MSEVAENPPVPPRAWIVFLVAGLAAGAASFPVLQHLNDRYRFEPTGLITNDQALIDKENSNRARGDFLSSALQGVGFAAAFGVFFGTAAGIRARSLYRGLLAVVLGVAVGAAIGTFGRNGLRDFALYCISHNMRGLHVSAALQGLLWAGPIVGVCVGLIAALGFRGGGPLAMGAILGGVVACFIVPVAGPLAFPADYTEQLAEHTAQSLLTTLLVGGIVGAGVAFSARPSPKESSS